MDKGHWFWHSKVADWIEKSLLDLTHWIWSKRHASTEDATLNLKKEPELGPVGTVVPSQDSEVKKPARKGTPKAPKGNQWLKEPTK